MPRYRREKSETGIYHIMVRGINRMPIFGDEEDCSRFLKTLLRFKESDNYELYAYCLMKNHVHLLIKEVKDPIDRLMKRLGVSYVLYFNKKYNRVGHLFQDRYKSENIESEQYLLSCSRYIHNNPMVAGLVEHPEDYLWSSYSYYLNRENNPLLNTNFILHHFSQNRVKAIMRLKEFTNSNNQEKYLDDEQVEKIDCREAINEILARHNICLEDFKKMKDTSRRNAIIREIKLNTCVSMREMSRVLGTSKDIIFRA